MSFVLEKNEVVKLVNGKFKTFKCTTCSGKGWYWVREDGEMIDPPTVEDGNEYYEHPCEDCKSLGFTIVFDD